MRYALFGFGLASAVGALASCGSSSSSSGPSADSACTQIAAARCERVAACGVIAVAVRYGDQTTCEADQKAACMNSLAASSTAATPATTVACAKALPSVDCNDYNANHLPAACASQVGSSPNGAPCAFNAQCGSQFCGIPKNTSCGVCAAQPKVGDSCADLANCGQGLRCVAKGTLCADELTMAGDACDGDSPCGSGFSCVGAKAATATAAAVQGACQPAVETAGATCDPKRKTSADCDQSQGLACDPTSMTCIAIVVASAGQPCDGDLTVCGSASTCVIAAGASAGTCVAAAADGAACDTVNGPDCLTLSRCIVTGAGSSGICTLPADTCSASSSGASGASAGGDAAGGAASGTGAKCFKAMGTGASESCTFYSDSAAGFTCAVEPGFSTGTCPSDNLSGCCVISHPPHTIMSATCYYALTDSTLEMTACSAITDATWQTTAP